jgi:hypothetical protein
MSLYTGVEIVEVLKHWIKIEISLKFLFFTWYIF